LAWDWAGGEYIINHAITTKLFCQGLQKIVPSPEFVKTGKRYNATCGLLKDLAIISHRVNAVIEFGDPSNYEKIKVAREELRQRIPGYEALCALDPLVYDGREIIFNRWAGLHTDSNDPTDSWAVLVAAGDFKQGAVFFPHLGLRIRLIPGDIVAFRGRVIPHSVPMWSGGQRICIPHFIHSSVSAALRAASAVV
jgi:hypothetical protein